MKYIKSINAVDTGESTHFTLRISSFKAFIEIFDDDFTKTNIILNIYQHNKFRLGYVGTLPTILKLIKAFK